MKATDINRREREIKRAQKKQERLERKSSKGEMTVGDYIKELHEYFFYDEEKIFNIEVDERILETLENMKEDLPEDSWETVIRKAVKKTKVKAKEPAVKSLLELME